MIHGPPKGRVLVAEDEPLVRSLYRYALNAAGYAVVEAEDGEEAVARFVTDPDGVTLVLLDLGMPKLSGIEAWRRIQAHRPHTPVVFCTAYGPGQAPETPPPDSGPVLYKPVTSRLLLETVASAHANAAVQRCAAPA